MANLAPAPMTRQSRKPGAIETVSKSLRPRLRKASSATRPWTSTAITVWLAQPRDRGDATRLSTPTITPVRHPWMRNRLSRRSRLSGSVRTRPSNAATRGIRLDLGAPARKTHLDAIPQRPSTRCDRPRRKGRLAELLNERETQSELGARGPGGRLRPAPSRERLLQLGFGRALGSRYTRDLRHHSTSLDPSAGSAGRFPAGAPPDRGWR